MRIPDTNAWYVYLVDFWVMRRNGRAVRARRRNRDAVAAAINEAIESGELAIPYAVAAEVQSGIKRAFASAARSAGAAADPDKGIAESAWERFSSLPGIFGLPDADEYLGEIGRMYARIRSGPRMAAAAALWRRVKERRGRKAARPPPGTHRADFEILSAAAAAGMAARGMAATLPTFDRDFVAFAGAIYGRFGVEAAGCGALPR